MEATSESMATRLTLYDVAFVLAFYASLAYGIVYLSLPWVPIALEGLVSILLPMYYILSPKPIYRDPQTGQLYRKIFHIVGGSVLVIFMVYYPSLLVIYLVDSLLALFSIYEILRWYVLRRPIWISKGLSFFGDRGEVQGRPFVEALFGLLGVLVTISFFEKGAAICGLVTLSLGDGASGLIGERIKTPLLPFSKQKTVGGLFAGIVSSSLVALLLVGDPKVLAGTLLGMIVEAFSGILDNFLVPVSSAWFYAVLRMKWP